MAVKVAVTVAMIMLGGDNGDDGEGDGMASDVGRLWVVVVYGGGTKGSGVGSDKDDDYDGDSGNGADHG